MWNETTYSFPKRHYLILVTAKYFHPTHYTLCGYLYMLGLKLFQLRQRVPCSRLIKAKFDVVYPPVGTYHMTVGKLNHHNLSINNINLQSSTYNATAGMKRAFVQEA